MAVTRRRSRSRSRSPAKRRTQSRRRRSPAKKLATAAPSVVDAITALSSKNGSSSQAILKYISANGGGRATAALRFRVLANLRRAIASGAIQRTAAGYRLATAPAAKVSFY